MFEVGFTEILVISVLALVVLGPEKLPRVAAQIGRWVGRARAMARQFREQLEDEVTLSETNKAKAKESARAEQDVAAAQSATAPSPTPGADASTPADASAPYGSSTQNMYSGVTGEHDAAAHAASETAHHADPNAPAPEPEATEYQPPAYAHAGANGHAEAGSPDTETSNAESSTPQPSPVQSQYAHEHDDPPLKPGDVLTHTHERGI
jgi:sec-independent protein translocase protein TatB